MASSERFFIDFGMGFCDDNGECIDPPNVPSRPTETADVKDRDELYLSGIISQGEIACNILWAMNLRNVQYSKTAWAEAHPTKLQNWEIFNI